MIDSEGGYTLIGTDLSGLWLQPGFVEGIAAEGKRFGTLEKAYRRIFRRNLESAVLLWNGLPVKLNYTDDLPAMVSPLIDVLWNVQNPEARPGDAYDFQSPTLRTHWHIDADQESVTIDSFWEEVPGHYEAALNQLGLVRMRREAFLSEWKLLLQQMLQAFEDAEAILTRQEARNQLQKLREIEANIAERGRFYRY